MRLRAAGAAAAAALCGTAAGATPAEGSDGGEGLRSWHVVVILVCCVVGVLAAVSCAAAALRRRDKRSRRGRRFSEAGEGQGERAQMAAHCPAPAAGPPAGSVHSLWKDPPQHPPPDGADPGLCEAAEPYGTGMADPYPPGSRVTCQYGDGIYPGTVVCRQADGMYTINWEDQTHSRGVHIDCLAPG
eukprot:TRINITY_DN23398_c0_g1_i1.p2 TRINITY_DN23398_c0_g1~~TRINITY_DN23398_c0_g1_i1.p2  ORF type:complete len:219 (+),score=48.03 TRINITY_DN23398_c0_g1_i1:99-659(+)